MNSLKLIVVLAMGLTCLSLIGSMIMPVAANQCIVRKLTLQPGMVAGVSVGYPEQQFNVLFNTGSANTWVVGMNCTTQFCISRNRYKSSDSSTHLKDGRPWRTSLAVGAIIEGQLTKDTFGLAGAFTSDQLFGEVLTSHGWIVDFFGFDGVLGLGSRFSPALNVLDPIQTMYRQKFIPKQMFSLHVTKNQQDDVIGTAVLGGVDEEYFKGEISYVPIINRWTFYLDYLTVPNSDVKHSIRSKALIDSTSNLVLAPVAIVEMVTTLFGAYEDPRTEMARWNSCEDVPNDTSITLVVSGVSMTLSAKDLVIKLENGRKPICYMALHAHIEESWVLGTPFLKRYYTVFDYEHKRVGFAASA